MTRDDIIRMAREAGWTVRCFDGEDEVMDGDNYHIQTDIVEQFAALVEARVAAAEREACAKACESLIPPAGPVVDLSPDMVAMGCAAAIRARGQA